MVNPFIIIGLVVLAKGIADEISEKPENRSEKPENEILMKKDSEISETQTVDNTEKSKKDSEKPEKGVDETPENVLGVGHEQKIDNSGGSGVDNNGTVGNGPQTALD